MRYSDSFLDEIRARLPVSQVVARKVALKRAGREFKGLSPFKVEKTPSFFVNDHKGFFHCFASGQHGDIFSFLMKTEGLPFSEAVERLAGEAGIPLPKVDAKWEAQANRRTSLLDVMKAAAEFYVSQLKGGTSGLAARTYLLNRGVLEDTIAQFQIGYAPPSRSALKTHLLKAGFTEDALIACGLLIKPEGGGLTFDRFRDRVMIPINDSKGRVIAFGGRALQSDIQPKYLNSPETELFHKGATLFNAHRARQPAFESDDLIVVEGYLDAIAIYQAGLKNVVATLGTAFTEQQIEHLWRLAAVPTVCFDGDRAGEEAAYRAIDRILPGLQIGRTVDFAFMPPGKDPDDLIREKGRTAFAGVLSSAIPLHEALWRRELRNAQIETPEGKAALERRYYQLVNTIAEPTVRKHYVLSLRIRLSKFFWDYERARKPSNLHAPGISLNRGPDTARIILGMGVHYPELFEEFWERLGLVAMEDKYARFRDALIRFLLRSHDCSVATIYAELGPHFYDVLEEVHGSEATGGKWGYNLLSRCSFLEHNPDETFIRDYFELLIRKLEIQAAEAEQEDVLADLMRTKTEVEGDQLYRQLFALRHEIERQKQETDEIERELDERAEEFRSRPSKAEAA